MNKNLSIAFLMPGLFLLPAGLIGNAAQPEPSYQEKLEKEQANIDAAVAQAGGIIAIKLADKFGLKPEEIQKIRDGGPMGHFEGGPGWGEITILLSMAHQLKKAHPKDYPTYDKALGKVKGLRAESDSYEKIASLLEINLQPVLADVQHIRADLKTEKRY